MNWAGVEERANDRNEWRGIIMGSRVAEQTMRGIMLGYHRDAPPQYMPACDEASVWIEVENERGLKTAYIGGKIESDVPEE